MGLDVDSKRAGTLPVALVNGVGGRVINVKHGHKAVGDAVCASNEGSTATDFVDTESNALGDLHPEMMWV